MEKAVVSAKIMDDKRTQTQTSSVSSKSALDFAGEVKSEFKKITWTEKDELKVYTKVVVAFTFIFGMSVLFADVVIQQGLVTLNSIIRLVAG